MTISRTILIMLVCFGTAGLVIRTPRPISTAPSFKSIVKPRRNKETVVALASSNARLNTSRTLLKTLRQEEPRHQLNLARNDQTAPTQVPSLETAPDRIHMRC